MQRDSQAVVPVLRTTPMEDGIGVTLTVPETLPCGHHRVSLEWNGAPASDAVDVTVRPFIRGAPAVLAVTDGIDLLSRTIHCGVAKLWIRDLTDPAALRASLGGQPIGAIDLHCEDTVDQRYQVNLAIPAGLPAGHHRLDITVAEATVFSEPIDIQPHASG